LYFRASWLSKSVVRNIIIFALLWLCAQMLTDIIRETSFADWSRGWSKIVFFQLNFIALYLLLSKRQARIIYFCAGIAVGQIVSYFVNPNSFVAEYPWKFGLGYPITTLFVLLSQTAFIRRIKHGTEVVIGVAAVLNLLLGFRSLALICVSTTVYIFTNERSHRLLRANKLSKWALIKLIILFIGVGVVTAESYRYAAQNGWLSEKETIKYKQQASGKYGVLLSGRTEFIASSAAILDSPVIGHGSWAKDPKYSLIVAQILSEFEYENPAMYISKDDLIPTHSYLFGAWVESGIMGAVFWGWLLLLVLKTLWKLHIGREKLLPLVAFICFNMLWNILFSPFGAETRMYVAYHLVLIIFVLSRATPKIQSGTLKLT
jgi:hypothetical protein